MAAAQPVKVFGTIKETLDAMGRQFNIAQPVIDALVAKGFDNLAEFKCYFLSEAEVGAVVEAESAIEAGARPLQTARLRRAWQSVRRQLELEEKIQDTSVGVDDESPITALEMRNLETLFHQRYRISFAPSGTPSDTEVSRSVREIERRTLTVRDISAVRSLASQHSGPIRKKLKLADNMYISTGPDDVNPIDCAETYLRQLQVYLLSLAKAGVVACPTAPTVSESLESDSTKYVKFPLDFVFKYMDRARASAESRSESTRFAWLKSLDVQERSDWVRAYRTGTRELGVVVNEIFQLRDAHWSIATPASVGYSMDGAAHLAPSKVGPQPKQQQQQQQKGPAKASSSGAAGLPTSDRLRDGTILCKAFNAGACKNNSKKCPLGAHRCSVLRSTGRVCGDPKHGACNH
jgi:hypothetical protein